MTLFTDEEIAVYEARTRLNCVLQQKDDLIKEHKEKLAKLDSIIANRESILTDCIHKLPEKNVFNE